MPKITYDPEVEILSIRINESKIADSDIQENCVIDYDKDGNIVNIDVTEIDLTKILSINKNNPSVEIKK